MELRLSTDLSTISPNQIAFNKAEISAYLDERLAKYKGRVFTESEIEEAKKARALINKVEKAMNDEKIRVKKAFTEPYTRFENDVKELMAKCSDVSAEIDKQVKEYENSCKAEKKAKLVAHFNANIGDAKAYVTFDDIFDPKWLNATVDEETAKVQITEIAERFKQDVEVLASIETDIATKVSLENRYKATKNIGDVLRFKKEIDERAKQAAEAAAQQARTPPAPVVHSEAYYRATMAATAEPVQEETVTVQFQVTTTPAKLNMLKAFLMQNGITYGKVTNN